MNLSKNRKLHPIEEVRHLAGLAGEKRARVACVNGAAKASAMVHALAANAATGDPGDPVCMKTLFAKCI